MRARVGEFLSNRWSVFASRLVLGGIFLIASVGKIQQQAAFIDAVKVYGILPDSLAQAYGLVVPWVELFVGCCLILGVFSRLASALSIPLTLSFVIASSYALINAVGVNCGCFGEVIILSHPVSLSLDCLMLATALVVLFSRTGKEFLSTGHLLSRYTLGPGRRERLIYDKAGRLAVVALAMAVVTAMGSIAGGAQEFLKLQIDTALEQSTPVFTYFYAEKCSACEEIEPLINELEHEYRDRIAFIHIDLWEATRLAEELGVGTTPTMLLITGKDDDGQYIVYQRFDKNADEETLRGGFELVLQPGDVAPVLGEVEGAYQEWIDSTLESGKPVFLFFYQGCACVKELGMIANLEQEYGDRIVFIRIGYGEATQAVEELAETIPGMLLITGKDDDGKYIVYQRFYQTVTEETLRDSFEQVLQSGIAELGKLERGENCSDPGPPPAVLIKLSD